MSSSGVFNSLRCPPLSANVIVIPLSRRKQGFDSPWERQAQNKRSLLNGYQKIWRRFCDAVPLRIRLARDLFGEKALMGARLVKHRLVGIESNRGSRCRSCDRQSSSEFGRLLR